MTPLKNTHFEKTEITKDINHTINNFESQVFGHKNRHQTDQYIQLLSHVQRTLLICSTLGTYQLFQQNTNAMTFFEYISIKILQTHLCLINALLCWLCPL